MSRLETWTKFLAGKRAVQAELQDGLVKAQTGLDIARAAFEDTTAARDVVNAVLVLTQGTVKGFIEEIVTLALSAVYGGEYRFRLDYSVRRNQTEAKPVVLKISEDEEDEFDPRDELGGGVVDVISLGLRLAAWAMGQEGSVPVFVLDEPAKFVSPDRLQRVAEMLGEVSRVLGLQIIMVSHDEALIDYADRAFRVTQTDGISRVEVQQGAIS